MKKFTVSDVPARFGAGAMLGLTDAQFATRAHNVDVLPDVDQTVKGYKLVRASVPLEFRVGEEILVEGEEAVAALVDPLTGQKQSSADRARTGSAKKKAAAAKAAPAKKGRG